MIVEPAECTLLAAASWPENLSHSLPKKEAMQPLRARKLLLSTSNTHLSIRTYLQRHFVSFCVLSLNVPNLAQILN